MLVSADFVGTSFLNQRSSCPFIESDLMTDLEQFALTLAEVGPQFDDVEQIDVVSEDTWAVYFSDDSAVEVHFDTVGNALSFTMPVGAVPSDDRESLFATMLSYNFLKRESGGFHLAIDGEDGDVWLLLDVHHTEINSDTLIALLATVVETGNAWRAVLSGTVDTQPEIELTSGAPTGVMRV